MCVFIHIITLERTWYIFFWFCFILDTFWISIICSFSCCWCCWTVTVVVMRIVMLVIVLYCWMFCQDGVNPATNIAPAGVVPPMPRPGPLMNFPRRPARPPPFVGLFHPVLYSLLLLVSLVGVSWVTWVVCWLTVCEHVAAGAVGPDAARPQRPRTMRGPPPQPGKSLLVCLIILL